MKKLKEMTNIKELDKISDKYPSNIKICKEYLKKLKNEEVKIEENEWIRRNSIYSNNKQNINRKSKK